jgi:lysophospholipase L1-like esterase
MDRRHFIAQLTLATVGLSVGACGGSGGNGSGGSPVPSPSPTPSPTPAPIPQTPGISRLTIAFAGASSAELYLSNGTTSPPADDRVRVTRDGTNYVGLNVGAFGMVAGRSIATALGRNIDFISAGASGTTLAQWAATVSSQRQRLVAACRAAGGVDVVLLQVGFNDVTRGLVQGRSQQLTLLRTLINAVRTEAGVPNAQIVLGATQNLEPANSALQEALAQQRLAELDAAADIAGVSYGFSTYDLATTDGIHQTAQSQILSGTRFAEHVIARMTSRSLPHGPRGLLARRVTATTSEVQISLFDGANMSPTSGIDGFYVEDASGISRVTSATRVSNQVIQLQHRALNAQGAWIRYALDSSLGLPGCVRDTSTALRPMEPMRIAL